MSSQDNVGCRIGKGTNIVRQSFISYLRAVVSPGALLGDRVTGVTNEASVAATAVVRGNS